jgi:hypothetical protein
MRKVTQLTKGFFIDYVLLLLVLLFYNYKIAFRS